MSWKRKIIIAHTKKELPLYNHHKRFHRNKYIKKLRNTINVLVNYLKITLTYHPYRKKTYSSFWFSFFFVCNIKF
jgi:hypothetical protein